MVLPGRYHWSGCRIKSGMTKLGMWAISYAFSPDIIKKIKKVHIKTGRMVNTLMAGQYRSVFRGAGIEFEEVREYAAGDDVKSIDWKVSARMGKPFIKRYREEREQVVMLLVDMSAPAVSAPRKASSGKPPRKSPPSWPSTPSATMTRPAPYLFTDQVERYIPPKKGSAHVWRLIREIFTFQPEHTGNRYRRSRGFSGPGVPQTHGGLSGFRFSHRGFRPDHHLAHPIGRQKT
jgi:hypothetical protein